MARWDRWDRRAAATATAVILLCDVVVSALGKERCLHQVCCYDSSDTDLATQLNCSSSSEQWINIDLTKSRNLEDVRITQTSKVSFKGATMANNTKLRRLLFSDIQELILESSSKGHQSGSDRAVSLSVRRVGALRLKTSAFLGWQSALATVSITDSENVTIDQDAFPAGSSFQRVRLSNISSLTLEMEAIRGTVGRLELENIRSLQLSTHAIHGSVGNLSLRSVTAVTCPFLAIGGSVDFVTLHSVALTSLKSGCLNAGRGWRGLALTDCHFGHLSLRSIAGSIDNVTISSCQIDSAETAAVSVTVQRLNLSTVSVGELAPRALQVTATSSVVLHRVSVSLLRPNALRGLQINDTSTSTGGGGGGGGISVSRLSVVHAEPGSLRFADGVAVTLKELLLPGGCVCSSPSWAHQLLHGPSSGDENGTSSDEDGPSSDQGGPSPDGEDSPSGGDGEVFFVHGGLATQRATLLRQVEAALCMFQGDSTSLADFTAQHCLAGGVSGQTQPDGRSAPLASWWSYLGVAALVALLLAAAGLLAIAVARCRRQRRRSWPDRPDPPWAAGVGLCSAGGPADGGEQEGSGHYCRLMLPGGAAEPRVLYSQGAKRLPDEGQRTDRSPPAGGSQREPVYANYPLPEQCGSASTGLYAVSALYAPAEECSCKSARLSQDEPVQAGVPHGERRAGPAHAFG